MSELTKSKYWDNEIAKAGDFDYAEDREIKNISSIFEQLAKSTNDLLIYGLEVQERAAPSMNVDIKTGLGFRVAGAEAIYNGSLMGPIAIANGGAQARIDTLEIRAKETDFDNQQRAFKDPGTGNLTYNDVETKTRYEIEAQVIQGTEGAGVAPNHTAGWMKVAEISVSAGQSTAIYNADIKNVTAGKDGEANSAWTAETAATFRLKSLSEIKSLFRTKHDEDGDHGDDVIQDVHIDFGTGSAQVDADLLPLGTDIIHNPTGGTPANLTASSLVRPSVQKILDLLIDLSGVQNGAVLSRHIGNGQVDSQHYAADSIDDEHINFGTGAGQVSAVDIPIADAGGRITATEVEGALQELAGSGRTTQTIKGNWDAMIQKSILTTQGDFVVRGASAPERLAAGLLDTYLKGQGVGALPIYEKLALRDTGIKIGYSIRTTAGNQAITGVGFEPSVVVFFAVDDASDNINLSWGLDDCSIPYSTRIIYDGTSQTVDSTYSISIVRDASNMLRAKINSMDTDGFTLTWTLAGACPVKFIYLCLP